MCAVFLLFQVKKKSKLGSVSRGEGEQGQAGTLRCGQESFGGLLAAGGTGVVRSRCVAYNEDGFWRRNTERCVDPPQGAHRALGGRTQQQTVRLRGQVRSSRYCWGGGSTVGRGADLENTRLRNQNNEKSQPQARGTGWGVERILANSLGSVLSPGAPSSLAWRRPSFLVCRRASLSGWLVDSHGRATLNALQLGGEDTDTRKLMHKVGRGGSRLRAPPACVGAPTPAHLASSAH